MSGNRHRYLGLALILAALTVGIMAAVSSSALFAQGAAPAGADTKTKASQTPTPVKGDAAKPDPGKSEPTKQEPAKTDPTKTDPTKSDPDKVDPTQQPDKPAEINAWLTLELLSTRLNDLKENKDLTEEERTTASDLIKGAVTLVTNAAKVREQAAADRKLVDGAAAETERIRLLLKSLDESPPAPFVANAGPDVTTPQLQDQLTRARQELKLRQEEAAAAETVVKNLKDSPARYRSLAADAQAKLTAVLAKLAPDAPPSPDEKPAVAQARRVNLRASERSLKYEIDRFEQLALAQDTLAPLRTAQRDLAARQVPPAEQKVKVLEAALDRRKLDEAALAAAQAQRALQEAVNKAPQIRELVLRNAKLATENTAYQQQATGAARDAEAAKLEVDDLEKEIAQLKEKVTRSGIDRRLARNLIKRRRALTSLRDVDRTVAQLVDGSHKFEDDQELILEERKKLDNFDAVVKATMEPSDSGATPVRQAQIEAEVRQQLTKLKENLTAQADHLGSLYESFAQREELERKRRKLIADYQAFIDQNLLWIADADPISASSFPTAGEAIIWLLSPASWTQEFLPTLWEEMVASAWVSATVLVVVLGLWLSRWRVRRRLQEIEELMKKVDTDRFGLTPQAIVLTVLRMLPWPLLIIYVSMLLRDSWRAQDFTRAVAAGLGAGAATWLALRSLRSMLRPQGIAEVHLRWQERTVTTLRGEMRWLLIVGPPASFVMAALSWLERDAYTDSLARLVFMAFMVAAAVFSYRVFHPSRGAVAAWTADNPRGFFHRTRFIWFPGMLATLIAMGVLAGVGYFYTARQLGGQRLQATLWLLLGVLAVHSLLLRWLFITRRRFAMQKARQMREAAEREGAGATSPAGAGAPAMDLAQINEQTQHLIRSLMTVATVVGMYLIWSGVLPALRVLDHINLWEHSRGMDNTVRYITLGNVLIAILAGFLTYVASRNVPGLLEITILKRTPLDAGGRYAFATISRYVITVVGVVLMFQAIGVGWDQVQWLVAAVSLGLGFGLQEIFANFVSGLIILFERPVRVGDIVTVGDTSGTVSRIRIRATTITLFDRKELVVPNKEFITARVLNWTLSDTVNRVEVLVGVAYGTDPELVMKVLRDCALANQKVMTDPAPVVMCDGFGDSSINFKMFVFVASFTDRLEVINSIHAAVNRALCENGIEIPYPQRDLHLRTMGDGVLAAMGHGNGQSAAKPALARPATSAGAEVKDEMGSV